MLQKKFRLASPRGRSNVIEMKRRRISAAAMARAGVTADDLAGLPGPRQLPLANPFQFPHYPPGVEPQAKTPTLIAQDEAIGEVFNWAARQQGGLGEGLIFLGYPLLSELAQRPEYRRISETLATEMTRKWIRIHSISDEDKTDEIDKINELLDNFHVRDAFRRVTEQDGFFGRAHLFLDFGDDDPDELKTDIGDGRNDASKNKVKRKSLQRIVPVEATWCYPLQYNTTEPLSPDWYRPRSWMVRGKEVHSSRLLLMVGREVPDMLKPAYAFGGLSMSQMAQAYVNNWIRTRQSVSDLIHSFAVTGLKTDLRDILMGGAGTDAYNRMAIFAAMRDNRNAMVLNKDEEFFCVTTPLGTLDKLQAQSQEHMSAVSTIPLVKLTGITPSGLNASSDGEIRVFYDSIHAQQEKFYTDPLKTILSFIQLSEFGKVDPDIGFTFNPLWALTEKEQAEVRKTEADTDAVHITSGVLEPEEARKRLSSDPAAPYASIEADSLPVKVTDVLAAFEAGVIDAATALKGLRDSNSIPNITAAMIKEVELEPPMPGETGMPGASGDPGAPPDDAAAKLAEAVRAHAGGAGGQRDLRAVAKPSMDGLAGDKSFEESKHPRDKGKFSSSQGSSSESDSEGSTEESSAKKTAAHKKVATWLQKDKIAGGFNRAVATVKTKVKDPEVVKGVLSTAVNQAIGHYVYTHDYMDSDTIAHAIQHIEVGLAVSADQAKGIMKHMVKVLLIVSGNSNKKSIAADAADDEDENDIIKALRAMDQLLSEGDDGMAGDAGFEESKHPRGQPGNKGQFGPGGGGGKTAAAPAEKGKGGGEKRAHENAASAHAEAASGHAEAASHHAEQAAHHAERSEQHKAAAEASGKGAGKAAAPGAGEGEHPHANVTHSLFEKYGGVGTKTGAQIAAEAGATEAIAKAEKKLAASVPTDAPVDKGGHKLPDGTFTPERRAVHKAILDKLFNPEAVAKATPDPGQKPTMVFLGGRGGSGKSWLTSKDGPVDEHKFVVVDADAFKGQLPGYEGWNAASYHEESSHLVDLAEQQAIAAGVNIVHDATLKTESSALARAKKYQAAGYDIHGHYMFASPATATGRAMGRFMRGGEKGRFVPPDVVMGNVNNEKNFDKMKSGFSKWTVYDNNAGGGGTPKLVAKSEDR